MISKRNVIILLALTHILGCNISPMNSNFIGFWEGPHPENSNKKFYVQIVKNDTVLYANGYWTENNFYTSHFEIDSLKIFSDSIRFHIPNWNCNYVGKLLEENSIVGGFQCEGEAFDTVILHRNFEIKNNLVNPKPNCDLVDYVYEYNVPIKLNDNIETSTYFSKSDSIFINSLVSEIIDKKYGRINSFLLLKNDKLICEEYFWGYTQNDLHQIESSTKSIASLLIGIAIDQKLIKDLDEPLYEIFPREKKLAKPAYRSISIESLLTMKSGFQDMEGEIVFQENRISFALNRELIHKPGDKFIYDGGNTEILGGIIKLKTGMYADQFAAKFLFEPLNIENYNWNIFKQNKYPSLGGSLQLLPRDMAKIGLLVLNNGKFNDRQVVSKEWIKNSTSFKTKTHIDGDDYAYHWWNIRLKSGEKSYNTIWANGWGGQFIYIIPELDVVIVTTGYNYEYDSWAITKGIEKFLYLLDK
jgi:Beta-lactamase